MKKEIKYNTILSPFKWFILENFPYIEEDFDALTNWRLFCKLGKEMNKVIAKVNACGEQTENLTNAFNELYNYVNNYFENLDVQEEINNKLDEMAESGELEEIISQYLNSTAIFGFDNVNSMLNATNLINGSYAKTLGFYNKNDGGSALYKIRTITNDDVVDNMTILEMQTDNTLIAELIEKNEINIKQLGARESTEDNTNDIKTYLEKAFEKFNKIIIPNGTYFLTKFEYEYQGECNKKLVGQGNSKIYTTQGIFFNGLENSGYNTRIIRLFIDNLIIYGGRTITNLRGIGINLDWFGEVYISNCYFRFLNYGIKATNGSEIEIKNCISLGNLYGMYFEDTYSDPNSDLDALTISDCPISNNTHNVVLDSVRGTTFNNCIIANGKEMISYGIEIKNTNENTNNININNCEFENNKYNGGQPSILSGTNEENNVGCGMLNINNCKFVSYSQKTIQLNNGVLFNLNNTIISTEYAKLISIGINANRLKINMQNCYRFMSSYIEDLRTKFYGAKKFEDMKALNFFPEMKHSVTEMTPSVAPTYDSTNKKVTFASGGFVAYNIKEKNYIPQNGLQVLVIGKNLGKIYAVINGVEVDKGKNIVQTLADGSEVLNVVMQDENITQIRVKFSANSEISRFEIYGDKPNALPLVPFTSITSQNFIGEPDIGDVIAITNSSATKKLMVWNGTAYE